jgi:hypothetical protein
MPATAMRHGAIVILAAFAIAGCASMSKQECRTVDWRTVGYEDGAAGLGTERLTSRRKACARHGVTPDLDAYRSGREEGLRDYCQPANGFRVGARGVSYGGACPADLATAFYDAYQAGRNLWTLESQLNSTIRGIAQRRAEIVRLDEALAATGVLLLGDTATPDERAKALVDAKEFAERRGRLKSEIESLERALPGQEAELENYRAHLAYLGY